MIQDEVLRRIQTEERQTKCERRIWNTAYTLKYINLGLIKNILPVGKLGVSPQLFQKYWLMKARGCAVG
jgi:hypothetical protein